MNRLIKLALLMVSSLLVICFISPPTKVSASTDSNKILLVYDSQNNAAEATKKIDALQRSLTSMSLQVKTVGQDDYKAGMLNQNYAGVITMINWREVGLTNQKFIKDREKFNGIKLHIGPNLDETEIKELGGRPQTIYRQQFTLRNKGNEQLLPFSETLTVLHDLPEAAQEFGILETQQEHLKDYPFGVINGKNAYLPFFRSSGLSMMVEIQLIGQLFNQVGKYQPMLTFTKITPYSDLKLLDELSLFCYRNEIPFAVSTTSVIQNSDMKAFGRFTTTLRNIESRGGIIFLQAPEVSNADNSPTSLNQKLARYLVSLSQHQVFPVGFSAEGFWNQDQVLRNNYLSYADHWLLLPNDTESTFVKQDNDAKASQQTFFTMSMASLKEVKKNSSLRFAIPTALTIPLPESETRLEMIKKEIMRSQISWYDPVDAKLQTEIKTPSTILKYKYGNYFANGKPEEVQVTNSMLNRQFSDGKPKSSLKGYFKVQGRIFMIFFVVITIILVIFIYMGQKVYWNRLRRKK